MQHSIFGASLPQAKKREVHASVCLSTFVTLVGSAPIFKFFSAPVPFTTTLLLYLLLVFFPAGARSAPAGPKIVLVPPRYIYIYICMFVRT